MLFEPMVAADVDALGARLEVVQPSTSAFYVVVVDVVAAVTP